MKQSSCWKAAVASTLLLAGGAWAQSQGGENPAPTGDPSLDCANGSVNASGTSAARGSTMKSSRAAPVHKTASRDARTLHAAFPQCSVKNDREARAECVRTAWESRYGVPGERTSLASSSTRRPC